jgi:hypothetical protein
LYVVWVIEGRGMIARGRFEGVESIEADREAKLKVVD